MFTVHLFVSMQSIELCWSRDLECRERKREKTDSNDAKKLKKRNKKPVNYFRIQNFETGFSQIRLFLSILNLKTDIFLPFFFFGLLLQV